jgi:HEAT repeat protein
MRAHAADALGKLGDPRAVPDLLRALEDKVDMVRGHAANALGQIGDRRAVSPLLDLLREPDMLIRWTAAEALGHLGDPSAVLPLLEAWINADHEMILEVTGEAISRIGEAAQGPLREALDDPREEVQRAARYILGQLGAPQ